MESFDAIVVGAGPAGLGAGYRLAKDGFSVLIIERGSRVGSKNIYGGRIYSHIFREVLGGLFDEAPVERWVVKERFTVMDNEGAFTLEKTLKNDRNSFTAYLPEFLRWLAKLAEGASAMVLTGVKVDGLVVEDGWVKGVLAGGDRILADVVIDAEGVNPILAMQAGLRGDWGIDDVALGVKEVIRLPRNIIEERLGLRDDEGLAQLFIGYPTRYLPGGGFLYTNKETISLGVVVKPRYAANIDVREIVEDFRQHPYVRRIIEGGEVVEYSAHLVPEADPLRMPRLYGNGILLAGDVAGFVVNTGLTVRGVDLAFLSGILAAETVKRAHGEGDFSEGSLSYYRRLIESSPIWSLMMAHRGVLGLYSNPRFFSDYPRLINQFLKSMYTGDDRPRRLAREALGIVSSKVGLVNLVRDLISLLVNL